jgi:hypothetical protein
LVASIAKPAESAGLIAKVLGTPEVMVGVSAVIAVPEVYV